MKKILFIACIAVFMLSMESARTAEDSKTRLRLKALMVYQFATKIDWPTQYKSGSFVIGVYGNDELYEEIEKNHGSKPVGTQSIRVKKYTSLADIDRCHILLIDKSKSGYIKQLVRKFKPYSTLVVSESNSGLQDGATINFIVQNNRNIFELSKSNAQSSKLIISQYILGFAAK